MAEKKKTGYLLPEDIRVLFDEIAEQKGVGYFGKWQVISAAIAAFAEMGERAQNEMIRRVREADGPGGSYERLLGELRQQHAKASVTPPTYAGPTLPLPQNHQPGPREDGTPTPKKRRRR